jgi:threonyl-tRNA synthetase
MVTVTFPDNTKKEFKKGTTGIQIAESIGHRLAKDALAISINGITADLNVPVTEDAVIKIITFSDKEGKQVFWHSTAHLMAHAVKRLFPNAEPTIGPSIDSGFYYDFDFRQFTPEDMEMIEKEMAKIVEENLLIKREEISLKDANSLFANNPYKLEIIDEYGDEDLSIYRQGDFYDLCKGPHVLNTGQLKSFKLTKASGAYWRGDSDNKQLARIYGVSFPDKKQLSEFLVIMEEAEKRDHKKLGKELGLFSFHEEGPGFPFFKPKGMVIWNELLNYWREVHNKWNYKEIKTPIMLHRKLWERSGHWTNYMESMYTTVIDDQDFAIKPMNCPGGILVYNETVHSYRELPLRIAEIGHVHRHELSGTLNGLFRVRSFHQDDAHIFMREDQISDEILNVLKICDEMYSTFGLTYTLELSTKPQKHIGTDKVWEIATNGLRKALDMTGQKYKVNEGDGAFYGPKIDIQIKDALGRTWQCGTIQLDMNLPELFDMGYEGDDGMSHRPVMIHRVVYGSVERFFANLVEHFAGKFPLWLSPVQVKLLPITDKHVDHCNAVALKMKENGLRVEIDARSETTNKKVRDAQLEQVNYILVMGDKEIQGGTVSVRTRDNRVVGSFPLDEFISKLKDEIRAKSLKSVF